MENTKANENIKEAETPPVPNEQDDTEREVKVRENPIRNFIGGIKIPCYRVPPCPRCGSRLTGRYLKYHSIDNDDYISKTSLKNGELIRFVPEVDEDHNLFCSECGFTWSEYLSVQWKSIKDIKEERRVYGTEQALNDIISEEKSKEKEQKRGLFHSIGKFIGHPF